MDAIHNFENHLFISYAHIDNQPLADGLKGWVDTLHERLAIRLAQLLGKPPKIWRDRKLVGNDIFNDVIVIELSRTAILLSVVSPRYLKSPACQSELNDFFCLAAQGGGIRVDEKHRVFKVVKTYVAREEHPPELRDLLGYEFYQLDPASEKVREFDHEISLKGEKDKRYWDKFEDLIWDITEFIKRLEIAQSNQPPIPSPSAATIYLAESTSDLSEERDKVKRELQQFGHVVLPDKALPLKVPALQEAVREYLRGSRLSVHLIGEHYGVIPEMETERSVVRLQQELAMERGDNGGFSRLIWMPPGLQPKDERQQKFVADLQNSFTSHNGSELLQGKLEDLKTIIQTKLTQKPKPVMDPPGDRVRFYLICDKQDVDAVEPLQTHLFDRGYEVMLPLLDGSEAEVLQDHKEILLLCDAVLIFQGRASEGWLRMKLRDLLKLPGYGRTSPLLGKAVYISAPESQPKGRFKTQEALVIKDYGEFNPSSLDSFLAEISKAKGALL
jgi:hypothetical protein